MGATSLVGQSVFQTHFLRGRPSALLAFPIKKLRDGKLRYLY